VSSLSCYAGTFFYLTTCIIPSIRLFHDSRQCSACCCSHLLWVCVQAFWFNVWQLMLGFCSPYVKLL